MACKVSEGVRTVKFASLEPQEIDSHSPSYPFPPLTLTHSVTEHSVLVLVLENDFLRVEIAPSLGGRIIELLDKTSKTRPISLPAPAPLIPGGPRGAQSPFGVQMSFNGSERLSALAPVDWSTADSEEGDEASVLIADSGSWPLSFHLTYRLEQDSAELYIEAKIFNRSLELAHYNGGLLCAATNAPLLTKGGALFADLGWRLQSEDLLTFSYEEGSLSAVRFDHQRVLAARQLDTWTAVLSPISVTQNVPFLADGLAVSVDEAVVQVEATRKFENLKLLVQTRSGETLEASISVKPGTPIQIPLGPDHIPLQGVAVLDQNRQELLRTDGETLKPCPAIREQAAEAVYKIPSVSSTDAELKVAAFDVRTRALAHLLIAMSAIRKKEPETASFHLEQSLLYNGEDHLAWWLKARCERTMNPEMERSDEILNAHFLAPHEPLLRAEALLGQPIQPGHEPNPVLAPLADNRDALLEASGQLVQAGFLSEASRMITEAMRFQDFPMLRYLLGYCYLTGSRMDAEAAEQLRAAGQLAFSPPYPVRPIEIEVLRVLSARWPDDRQLVQYRKLTET